VSDEAILSICNHDEMILLTADKDFGELSFGNGGSTQESC
jgi:predicted nuclease of predicted toxin-antitoxin system